VTRSIGDAAIVDYGMGNLFSVQSACAEAGLDAVITAQPEEIARARALILPGVGAFGEAMRRLREHGLDDALREFAGSGKPFFSICLGMQLLFDESEEFGASKGLGLLRGRVVRLPGRQPGVAYKVPSIGWNSIRLARDTGRCGWSEAPLAGIPADEHFYFVHSYYVRPDDPGVVHTTTRYAGIEYVSSLARDNLFACQFHPERSGSAGLRIYRNLAATLRRTA
jgi:imidazole glycerol-phosphate synthase subunit HisH